jgi:hypothetical protein
MYLLLGMKENMMNLQLQISKTVSMKVAVELVEINKSGLKKELNTSSSCAAAVSVICNRVPCYMYDEEGADWSVSMTSLCVMPTKAACECRLKQRTSIVSRFLDAFIAYQLILD